MPVSQFQQLFEISPFPAVVSRLRDSVVVAINRRTSETFGIPQDQAMGLRTIDYITKPIQGEAVLACSPPARSRTTTRRW